LKITRQHIRHIIHESRHRRPTRITKKRLRRIIKEEQRRLVLEQPEILGALPEPPDPRLADVILELQDIEETLMIMGGPTTGYRPRLDSPPLTGEQKYAMNMANEMREQVQKAIDILQDIAGGA